MKNLWGVANVNYLDSAEAFLRIYMSKLSIVKFPGAWWVKALAFSLLWLGSLTWYGFNPWPRDFFMPKIHPKKKKIIKLYTLNVCNLSFVNYTSIKPPQVTPRASRVPLSKATSQVAMELRWVGSISDDIG